ncbi:MAG: hypothetical protein J6Z22_10390, partial [Lachnospiraceae bacterium]|nr:hypothetical protein [Lachnospiraceae bacterium]
MRAKNIGKNSFFSIFTQVLIILAGFFSQRIINIRLGTELAGLNGVVSNVIAVFSVTELGLSTAIVFHLYRALAQKNEKKIASLMNLYRKAYVAVAGVIALLGLCFLPFVHLFMKENHFEISYIRIIYALWLIKTILGYLLSYKRSIVIADQKEYVASLTTMMISILHYLSIIVIVLCFNNYVWALSLSILFECMINLGLMVYVDKAYPFLKTYRKLPVDKELIRSIVHDIKNLFVTRIAQKLLTCTDNLIMSSFINLAIVGYYSNYCLITQSLINILQALSNALQPTVGNLIVEGKKERDQGLLNVFTYVFFFLSAIVLCGVAGVASLFVGEIWLGRDFLLPANTVFFCAVNTMMYVMVLPISVFVSASGLFQFEKKVAMASAIANLVISLALVKHLGIIGVLTGTLVAYLILLIGKTAGFHGLYLNKSMWPYLIR